VVLDAAGRIAEVNQAAEALFGHQRDDLIGRPVEVLLPTGLAPAGVEPAHLGPAGLEQVGRRRDGSDFPVEVSVAEVAGTDPGLDGLDGGGPEVVAVIRDLSGRRQVEADLGYLAAVTESCNDAVFSQDRDGLIIGWNPAAELLFGYRAEEVAGWRSTRLLAEDRWPDYEVVLRRVLAGEVHGHVETEIRRRDRVVVPVVLTVAPIRGGRGSAIGASVIARDLTEQKLALAALAESESRLREGESLAHVGGWVLDRATASVQWSEELHRMHGIEPVQFDGTLAGHVALAHPDDRAGLEGALARAIAEGEAVETEYRIVRPDGQVRLLNARAEPVIDDHGTLLGLRGIAQDVTERG
jgi:PAS domain S-box-containing protein